MTEQIVEAVGRLEIVELLAPADEVSDREDALAEHREEHRIGDQPGHRDGAPAGPRLEDRVQLAKLRYPGMIEPKQIDAVEKGRHDARAKELGLPLEQQVPDRCDPRP